MNSQDNCRSHFRNGYEMSKHQETSYAFSKLEKLTIMEGLDHLFLSKKYQKILNGKVDCETFSCSTKCQNSDWSNQEKILTSPSYDLSQSNSVNSKQFKRHSNKIPVNGDSIHEKENLVGNNINSPFKDLVDHMNKKTEFSRTENNGNQWKKQKQNYTNTPRKNGCDKNKYDRRNESSRDFHQRQINTNNKYDSMKKWDQKFGGNVRKSKNFSQDISKSFSSVKEDHYNKRKKVICLHKESEYRFWVMDFKKFPVYSHIQRTLNNECDKYETITPKPGLLCGCKYLNEWYRGRVVSTSPTVKVHFVDFGNTSEGCTYLKKLPDDLVKPPDLAFLIEYEEDTPSQYRTDDTFAQTLIVELTGQAPDGTLCVRVIASDTESGEDSDSSIKNAQSDKNSIGTAKSTFSTGDAHKVHAIDFLDIDSKGMILILPGEGKSRRGTLILENERCRALAMGTYNIELIPKAVMKGDYVWVNDDEKKFYRGKVVCIVGATYYVELLDNGRIISSTEIYMLPDKVKELPIMGVMITIEKIITPGSLNDSGPFFYKVTGEKRKREWFCDLKDIKEGTTIAKLSVSTLPESPDFEPHYVSFKSGCLVEISALFSHNSVYVRRLDKETEMKSMDLNKKITELAFEGESLASPPEIGKLYSVKFYEDDCYYRGLVKSLNKDKATVLFVDFGNSQKTDLKDVKPLLPSWKFVPYFAKRVSLQNVPDKPGTVDIHDYLKKLVTDNVDLIMTFKGSLSEGVTLIEKTSGVVVNKVLGDVKENAGDIFLDDILQYTTVAPGTTYDLALLYVEKREFLSSLTFWSTDATNENFIYVNGTLTPEINEYCNSSPSPYSPGARELCLVKFEDEWYRALVKNIDDDMYLIFFLDFGNCSWVTSESIRRIKSEFVKAPALTMRSTIMGLKEIKDNQDILKAVFNFLEQRMNTILSEVVVQKVENDTLFLRIPEVDKLVQELISTD